MLTPDLLDRVEASWLATDRHLRRSAALLTEADIPYAVIGSHAVGAWVRSVGESDRGTPNVDLLIKRRDHDRATEAISPLGTTWVHTGEPCLWNPLPTPESRRRNGTRLLHAETFVRTGDLFPNPRIEEGTNLEGLRVMGLEPLVRMKLVAFRTIDRVHLEDFYFAGLVDEGWAERLPPILVDRLRSVLDAPHVLDPRG